VRPGVSGVLPATLRGLRRLRCLHVAVVRATIRATTGVGVAAGRGSTCTAKSVLHFIRARIWLVNWPNPGQLWGFKSEGGLAH
jgi:hypothetical protein